MQEDEGFEKEPNLRTYTVVMVDPTTLLVWHADYVDHVDTDTLCLSFKDFAKHAKYKVLGLTKDKWQASTNAAKETFYGVWIGFCHRHCLQKFRGALKEYQKIKKCSNKERSKLYRQFKKILETATSKTNMKIKVGLLKDEAFQNPILKKRLDELVTNAVHYTAHIQRKGITKTTSIADNFLKIVKRKLRQVESFRDKLYASFTFKGMANVRNFLPFLSGAKNAHSSPFMLAGGDTHGLPWIQVMNYHNAFLFTESAF